MGTDSLSKVELTPIGFVKSEIKTPILHAGDSDLELTERMDRIRKHQETIRNNVAELIIFDQWGELLDGIEGFSHILVLYWPHMIDPKRRKLKKVHPMGRKELPLQGIFGTCSPARPNPVLVTAVRLLERNGNVLKVKGLEAVDGSPIIDMKPYVKSYYGVENPTVPDWMDRIQKEIEKKPRP
ncbi:MAG TPA: tRNA (N6-threonylcarbamoyladenosine(37)-N6)-methyltransferase TrmO [bacterium]|nr:tRNA (N6-threonylcarbamoyladenosine(37)-N6)-methyltransferase TrmO [bacterium]